MGQDPSLFAVDQLMRMLALGAIQILPWACLLIPVAYLHARWSRKR